MMTVQEDLYLIGLSVQIMSSIEELKQYVASKKTNSVTLSDMHKLNDAFVIVARIGGFKEENEDGKAT